MNPQLQSILTSVALATSSSIAAWAVSKGLLPGADQSSFATDSVGLASGLVAAGLAWWKTRALSQQAMVKSVNTTDNGVKVVAATSSAQQVILDKNMMVKPDYTAPTGGTK